LALESLDLELLLKRYRILKFRTIFVYLSEAKDSFGIIFQKPGVSVQNLDRGLILEKPRGFFAKLLGIIDFGIIFVRKKSWTRSTGRAPHPASVQVDRGQGLGGGSPELSLAAAPGHGSLPRGWPRKAGEAA
jgi:hypothetical protein